MLKLKHQQAEFEETKARIVEYIDGISDPLIRLIFRKRFVDRLSWQDVADTVGGQNTEYSVKKLCYRYLDAHP